MSSLNVKNSLDWFKNKQIKITMKKEVFEPTPMDYELGQE
jgi:hypothetical protein